MKKLIALLIVFQSYFLPSAFAQETVPSVSEATAAFEVDLKTAIYSVNEIPSILKDLGAMQTASGSAITQNIIQEVYTRLDTSLSLMTLIMIDPKLSDKQKFEMTNGLAGAIGEVLITIIRRHDEDKVDKNKLMKRVSEMTTVENAREILKEIFFDFRRPFYFPMSAERSKARIWSPLELKNRDQLGQNVLLRLQNYSQAVYPNIEDGKLKTADRDTWREDVLDKSLRIREYRLAAQKMTAYAAFGFAMWGFVAPHVDIVGAMTGQYNDNTLFTSSLVYMTGWVTFGLTKLTLTSAKTVEVLKQTIDMFKDPKLVTTPIVPKQTLLQKIKGYQARFCSAVVRKSGASGQQK